MGDIAPAIALAETLRSSGLRVQLYCEQKKFKQKMAYADKLKVPFAVPLGEDEIAEGKCSVKNMKTGEQLKLTPAEAANHIKASLDAETGTLKLEKSHSSGRLLTGSPAILGLIESRPQWRPAIPGWGRFRAPST